MITTEDAKYVLAEIRRLPYYEDKIGYLNYQLMEYDMMIADLTMPVSPNGGKDIVINGKTMRVKIHGNGDSTTERRISEYVSAQEPLSRLLRRYIESYNIAKRYQETLLNSKYAEYTRDFFSGKSYRELQEKYFITNAYDKMIRIITQTVQVL